MAPRSASPFALAFAATLVAASVPTSFGCAGPATPAKEAHAAPSRAPAPVAEPEAMPVLTSADGRALRRSDLRASVGAGLGVLLQHVDLDPKPVLRAGRFHGFRIAALDPTFRVVDLRPGDVVARVNGMPIERPEQAQEAFESLLVASELVVAYERDGEARELRIPIDDDEPAPARRHP